MVDRLAAIVVILTVTAALLVAREAMFDFGLLLIILRFLGYVAVLWLFKSAFSLINHS